MKKLEAKKDGNGNIIISEDSFEKLLACLDNQKFVGEAPQNGDSLAIGEEAYYTTQADIQTVIDEYNRECRKILHQKYIFSTKEDDYFLLKKYEYQDNISPWNGNDIALVYQLFKDTRILYKENRELLPLDGSEKIMEGTTPIGKDRDGWLAVEIEPQPWLIERPMRYDGDYLTISEDGINNRPWKKEEIEQIKKIFNN